MRTSPAVSVSSPAMQCINVDLPDPDGPMIAVKRPGGQLDGDVVERPHAGVTGAVDLRSHRTAPAAAVTSGEMGG